MTDPWGNLTGVFRVFRGGSFGNDAAQCRSAYRCAALPDHCDNSTKSARIYKVDTKTDLRDTWNLHELKDGETFKAPFYGLPDDARRFFRVRVLLPGYEDVK